MLIRALAAGVLAGAALTGQGAPSGTAAPGPRIPVIVFLGGQLSPGGAAPRTRSGEEFALQDARRAGATGIRRYGLVNAFAARMPTSAVADLAARPGVAEVIPDTLITGPEAVPGGRAPGAARAAAGSRTLPGACGPRPSLEPEGLQLTRTDSGDPAEPAARALGYTGGDEAFVDANAIAGQGHAYDIGRFSGQRPDRPCAIRIEGTAPGAGLTALKVFGTRNQTTTSNFLQAIDYAVRTARVNVISESFGANPFPDITSLDAVKRFNESAATLGVTVVVSSGDAGPFNTIGSPASDPAVLSAGASTAFRFYAQTNYSGADTFARTGWLDGNISALSSSGITQDGRTIDMVAPGDLGWASCTPDAARYSGCVNFLGRPSPIEMSGGTSEAAPEIAGAAALVIQAYRQAHRGATPPAPLVKRILTSSASDLGAPAAEQGAGLLDSYRAVRLAAGSGGAPLLSASQLNAVAPAAARPAWRVRVTNDGPSARTVSLSGRTFGAPRPVAAGRVTLGDKTSPHFVNWAGTPANYGVLRFRVPPGAGKLDAAIAWPVPPSGSGQNARVRLDLISPGGRFAADSLPQGNSGHGAAQVLHPAAGTWKAVIFSDEAADKGTAGQVRFGASVSRSTGFGTVSPRTLSLAPGASGSFAFSAATPAHGGDVSGSVLVRSASGTSALPVTLRGPIPLTRGTGRFAGVLTGGNGRPQGGGQQESYQFTVARGARSLDANVTLANEGANEMTAYLVAPGGQVMGHGTNYLTTGFTARHVPVQRAGRALSAFAADPVPGTWRLVLDFPDPGPGGELADPFTGVIHVNTARASRGGLPSSAATVLSRGRTYRYPIAITNPGVAPEDVFLDPRLSRLATRTLLPQGKTAGGQLPTPAGGSALEWLVPAMTRSLTARAAAATPVTFDFSPLAGSPDLAAGTGTPAAAPYFGPAPYSAAALFPAGPLPTPVTAGLWQAFPSEAGPYPPGGAERASARMSMTATTLAFDPSFRTSGPGDFWRLAVDPAARLRTRDLFVIGPGRTRVITATIRPSAAPGTVVRGTLYVDDFADSPQFLSGGQLLALPYAYRVATPWTRSCAGGS